MLAQAPHLTRPLPTILPCCKLWEVPFFARGFWYVRRDNEQLPLLWEQHRLLAMVCGMGVGCGEEPH